MSAPTFNLREKIRSVPTAPRYMRWPIVFAVLSLFTLAWGFPLWGTYFQTQRNLENLIAENKRLEAESQTLEQELRNTEAERLEKGKDYLQRERQWLPEVFDPSLVASTLEMLALQLENLDLDREAHFNLESITFSPHAAGNQKAIPAQVRFSSDRENLKLFIDYLQNGTIPEVINRGVQQKFVSQTILKALQSQILPLSTIQQLQISENTKEDRLRVNMTIYFYQP